MVRVLNHFLVTELVPRTAYTIRVRADDDDPFLGLKSSELASIDGVTGVPEGVHYMD